MSQCRVRDMFCGFRDHRDVSSFRLCDAGYRCRSGLCGISIGTGLSHAGGKAMDKCSRCWARYMYTMALSRQVTDLSKRRALIREAYIWLQRYFDAEEHELSRRRSMLVQR